MKEFMKNGNKVVFVVVFLLACITMQMNLFAYTISENEMSDVIGEAEDIVEQIDVEEENGTVDREDAFDIFSLDWKNATDDELDYYLLNCADESVAAWVTSLSQEELEELLSRDTVMKQSLDYYGEDCAGCGLEWGKHFDNRLEYLLTLASCKNKRGTWYCKKYTIDFYFINGDEQEEFLDMEESQRKAYKSILNISGVDTTKGATTRQQNLTYTITNAKYGFRVTTTSGKTSKYFKSRDSYMKAIDQSIKEGKINFIYSDVNVKLAIDKPAGYTFDKWFKEVDSKYTYLANLYAPSQVTENQTFMIKDKKIYGAGYVTGSANIDDMSYNAKTENFSLIVNLAQTDKEDSYYGTRDNVFGLNYELELTPFWYGINFNVSNGRNTRCVREMGWPVGGTINADPLMNETWQLTLWDNGNTVMKKTVKPNVSLTSGWKTVAGTVMDLTKPKQYNASEGDIINLYGTVTNNAIKLPDNPQKLEYTFHYANGETITKSAYSFVKCWELAENGGTYNVGSNYILTEDVGNLYAVHEPVKVMIPAEPSTGEYTKLVRWTAKSKDPRNISWNCTPGAETSIEYYNCDFYEYTEEKKYSLDLNAGYGTYSEKVLTGEDKQVHHNSYSDLLLRDKLILPKASRTGYTHKGWQEYSVYADDKSEKVFYPAEQEIQLSSSLNKHSLYFSAVWIPNDVTYKVRYYCQSELGKNSYTLVEEDATKKAKADEIITIQPKNIAGFVAPKEIENQKINADGSTVIDLYYDIDPDYKEEPVVNPGGSEKPSGNENTSGNEKPGSNQNSQSQPSQNQNSSGLKVVGAKEQTAFENGEAIQYIQDGVTYQITKKEDGSAALSLISVENVANLVIPSQLTIGNKKVTVTEIKKGAFKGNANLKSITIGKEIVAIGDSAFEKCSNLKNVKFEKGSKLTTAGKKVFKDCKSLEKITLPKGVKNIKAYTFQNCVRLKAFTVPSTVKTIGKKAFYNCKKLAKVKVKTKGLKTVGNSAFKKCKKNMRFTFPSSKKKAYKKLLKGKY